MSRKFTQGDLTTKQSYMLSAKSTADNRVDIMAECHASIPFMVTLMSDVLYRLTKRFNQAPELLCKNAFWLMVREKVDERLKNENE